MWGRREYETEARSMSARHIFHITTWRGACAHLPKIVLARRCYVGARSLYALRAPSWPSRLPNADSRKLTFSSVDVDHEGSDVTQSAPGLIELFSSMCCSHLYRCIDAKSESLRTCLPCLCLAPCLNPNFEVFRGWCSCRWLAHGNAPHPLKSSIRVPSAAGSGACGRPICTCPFFHI